MSSKKLLLGGMIVCLSAISVFSQVGRRSYVWPTTTFWEEEVPDWWPDEMGRSLPSSVDNFATQHKPNTDWGIQSGACGVGAAVAHCYSYEMNYIKGEGGSSYPYAFPSAFTTCYDCGEGLELDAWMSVDVLYMIRETGCPDNGTFGGFEWGWGFYGVKSGYNEYYQAMCNRIDEVYKVKARDDDYVERVKSWVYDHGNGSSAGGAAVIQTDESQWNLQDNVIYHKEPCGGHAMCIVGYDDNKAGGSWKVINNHGGEDYKWMPYSEVTKNRIQWQQPDNPDGEAACDFVVFCQPKKDYTPTITFKTSISAGQRNNIKIETGVANGLNADEPEHTKDYSWFFNFTGGPFPMCGNAQDETCELGLDLTDLIQYVNSDEQTFFLIVTSKGGGSVNSLSLKDYTNGGEETESSDGGGSISGTKTMSVSRSGSFPNVAVKKPDLSQRAMQDISVFPSPAGKSTRIVQFIPSQSEMTLTGLSVKDVAGRVVYSKKTGFTGAWNLLDNNGKRTAKGVYAATVSFKDGKGMSGRKIAKVIVTE
jgi:hypothetical protein